MEQWKRKLWKTCNGVLATNNGNENFGKPVMAS